eukprot:PITA_06985
MGWEIHQMGVKTTFLNGVILEEVYIEQPEGFETHEKRTHVCILKKSLYGLKQAPRAQIIGLIKDCKRNLATEFDMKDMGLMHYFLRPMVTPMITSWKTIDASGDKEVDPTLYRQLIGSLMYLVNTRPNICFAANTLSQSMVEPKRVHWVAARHILKYVRGIVGLGLKHTRGVDVRLRRFTDAD